MIFLQYEMVFLIKGTIIFSIHQPRYMRYFNYSILLFCSLLAMVFILVAQWKCYPILLHMALSVTNIIIPLILFLIFSLNQTIVFRLNFKVFIFNRTCIQIHPVELQMRVKILVYLSMMYRQDLFETFIMALNDHAVMSSAKSCIGCIGNDYL